MPTTTTFLQDPSLREKVLDKIGRLNRSLSSWLYVVQKRAPLYVVDTSGGPYSEALPAAGLNSSTGQSNQNQEIVYVKSSADANVFTVTGAIDGPHTITAQYGILRFKSDGTHWYTAGISGGGGGGGSVNKVAATIGDGVSTSFVVNHGLGTTDVVVQVHQLSGVKDVTDVEIQITDANNVTVIFGAAPAANDYRVVVLG